MSTNSSVIPLRTHPFPCQVAAAAAVGKRARAEGATSSAAQPLSRVTGARAPCPVLVVVGTFALPCRSLREWMDCMPLRSLRGRIVT